MVITVRPRSAGSFLISLPTRACANRSASSRMAVASSRDRSPAANRCLLMEPLFVGVPRDDHTVAVVVLRQLHVHALAARGRHVFADVIGAQRQFAMAAVDEHGQLNGSLPADVAQRVERGANRAART